MLRSLGDLVARGTRSGVYAYGRDAVIKVPDRDTPEQWIVAEARYADAVRAAGAPAPRLLEVQQVRGRAASVWEWVRGPRVWEEILAAPARAASYGRLLADLELELFALVPPIVLPSQRDRLVNKIRRSALAIDPALGEALDRLPAPSGPLRLCHGDLHPGNVILSPAGPVVIDWFDASRGDRAAEVARSRLLLRGAAGGDLPSHLPGATRPMLAALADGYLGRIQAQLDFTDDELRRWEAVEIVAQMAEHVPQPAIKAV
ncbi:MAG TPA: aminoglycoside phosphotransferase family protein [Baekduia sp.]|uniref:phosphotransferase enzyme family protein n=1 Tax=Baekduia sp. TaxID=2600305 RepID=UPI002C805DEC|nr:aminoglycoside phosphotransferase family protein [Baekduia sp.]HMJ37771.1 aminoglycoside phosphotransferase family protein [Baekduia sp.]